MFTAVKYHLATGVKKMIMADHQSHKGMTVTERKLSPPLAHSAPFFSGGVHVSEVSC